MCHGGGSRGQKSLERQGEEVRGALHLRVAGFLSASSRYLWGMAQRLARSHHKAGGTTGSTTRQGTGRANLIPATATGHLPRKRLFANVRGSNSSSPPRIHRWRCGFWLKPQSNPNQIKFSVASSLWAHNKKNQGLPLQVEVLGK